MKHTDISKRIDSLCNRQRILILYSRDNKNPLIKRSKALYISKVIWSQTSKLIDLWTKTMPRFEGEKIGDTGMITHVNDGDLSINSNSETIMFPTKKEMQDVFDRYKKGDLKE